MGAYKPNNLEEEKKPTQQSTGFTYDPFSASSETQLAEQRRQQLQAQKPADFTYQNYTPSATVQQAQTLVQQQLSAKPGAFNSAWQNDINKTVEQILNRDKFSYDLNEDALYQQYAQQYALLGQQAMMDTMGQAAAMTGGYGNSYAQSAGQQAYQGYLQQLNDRVPELYQLALNRYTQEGQDLMNRYGLLSEQEAQAYSRYQDNLKAYYDELDRLTEAARYESETDYGRFMDQYNMAYGQHRDQVADWQQSLDRADQEYWNLYNRDYGQYTDDRNFKYTDYMNAVDREYQQERDRVADQRYQQEQEYQKEQDRIAQENWEKQYNESVRQWQAEWDENQKRYDENKNAGETPAYYEPSQKDIDGILEHINTLAGDQNVTLSDFENYLDELQDLRGYSPDFVLDIYKKYSGKFKSKTPKPSFVDVPLTGNNTANRPKWTPIAMK